MRSTSFPLVTGAFRVVRRLFPPGLRASVRRWMFEWLDLAWQTPTGVRLRVRTYDEWIIYNEIFVNGDYDEALDRAIDAAGDRVAILDLGANVGFFTLRAVDRLRSRGVDLRRVAITAVEANTAFCRVFEARVAGENQFAPHVQLVPGFVGERTGRAAVDLSSLVAGIDRIDVMKCDIEGAEERLVATYPDVFAKTRVAVFELHAGWCDTDRTLALLRDYGFTCRTVWREGKDKDRFGVCVAWR